mmetsp:Transcript_68986/g.131444  ORF Transcript_68986/g.131444 Transcript_68986/m.131444 type:complete len:488 (-) Transcript_68986:63-1526(-)
MSLNLLSLCWLHLVKSVIPKSAGVALIGTLLALSLFILRKTYGVEAIDAEVVSDSPFYFAYSFMLGILIVFRNSQAYQRWWDGAQTIKVAITEWMDACMQLIAATRQSHEDWEQIKGFQHKIARLFSLLTCAALKHVAKCNDENYDIMDCSGLDERTKEILKDLNGDSKELMMIIEQWILNSIHKGMADGVIVAPSPIVSRVFQEIAMGTFHVERLYVISQTMLPTPYSLMLHILLIIHVVYTALIASTLDEPYLMCGIVFFGVFTIWCIDFIAREIEHPFGDDINDIKLHQVQRDVNVELMAMLDPRADHVPMSASLDTLAASFLKPTRSSTVIPKADLPGASDTTCPAYEPKQKNDDAITRKVTEMHPHLHQTQRGANQEALEVATAILEEIRQQGSNMNSMMRAVQEKNEKEQEPLKEIMAFCKSVKDDVMNVLELMRKDAEMPRNTGKRLRSVPGAHPEAHGAFLSDNNKRTMNGCSCSDERA